MLKFLQRPSISSLPVECDPIQSIRPCWNMGAKLEDIQFRTGDFHIMVR